MAAKVVIVAVPTVLSIASIRVYTVSEKPTDGLVPREKLNIYTPLPQPGQTQFVPESPGVIQNGLTTAREGVLPFYQAVKGACFSLKRGSVNLYHTGQDVFYYLKDPPPEFLPRFGTITMAGLLGMFLARKGSRFKRLAVPLSLMTTGATVCYPAQAVAVLKVTSKKVYAAGQWSSAAVSSLLSPKPGATESAASHPQVDTVPNPESAAVTEASSSSGKSSTMPETEVESAEFVPASDEPVAAVVTEEASSVMPAEISPDPTPAETNTDPVAPSVSAESKPTTTSEEIPAPVESEEPSEPKQAAEDVSSKASPTESTLEPEVVEGAEVKDAPVEAAPVETAPVEAAPVEAAPVEAAPVEAASLESAPVEAAPVEAAPVEAAPVEAAPVEAAPVEAAPVETTSVETAPVETAPVETAPVEASPVEATPVETAPAESAESKSLPSSEEVSAPKAADEPIVPVADSAESESAPQPELADPPQVTAVEETPTPTLTPPSPQQPAAEHSKGGSGFKPDPSIMDFGQASPEDEDLYSTRS